MFLKDIKSWAIDRLAKLPLEPLQEVLKSLLNAVEELTAKNNGLTEENQKLKDEINRLKGEKGKPEIKPSKDLSRDEPPESKKDPKARRTGLKCSKLDRITITRSRKIPIDRSQLPADAEHKGWRRVIIQDLSLLSDNIEFILERFYSPALGKAFESSLPPGFAHHQFGPHLRAFVITLHYQCRITQKVIQTLLHGMGVVISEGQVGEILLDEDHSGFHEEKEAVRRAGIEAQEFQQIDDTGARLNGQNCFTIVTCNDVFTSFTTSLHKDRLSALRALTGGYPLQYMINLAAIQYMRHKISNRQLIKQIRTLVSLRLYSQAAFEHEIMGSSWFIKAKEIWKKYIIEGCALAAYHAGALGPCSKVLVCDDAPQFKDILEHLGLCWIHEGRHYKKLVPQNIHFQKCLDDFLDAFWKFYERLKNYKKDPTLDQSKKLSEDFDKLFTVDTDYYALNHLIKKTKKKRDSLLLVLEFPKIPLHNNTAELDIREKVIQRKIRNCFRSWRGARASDTFLSLLATCRKQGLSFWRYILDRTLKAQTIAPLVALIRTRHTLAHPIAA